MTLSPELRKLKDWQNATILNKEIPWQVRGILRRVLQSNKDYIGVFCGQRGSGKSYSALSLAEKLDPGFNIDRVVFTAEDFIMLIRKDLPHGSVIIWDEVGVEFDNRKFQSILNKIINDALLIMRTKRLIVLMTVPSFGMFDSKGRAHTVSYFECKSVDQRNNVVKTKMLRIQQNPRDGKIYNKYYYDPDGAKVEDFIDFTKPTKKMCKEYDAKRTVFLNRNLDESLAMLVAFKQKELDKSIDRVQETIDKIKLRMDDYFYDHQGKQTFDRARVMNEEGLGRERVGQVRSAILKYKAEKEKAF